MRTGCSLDIACVRIASCIVKAWSFNQFAIYSLATQKAVSILRPFCALQQYKVPSTRGSVSDVLASTIGRRLSLTKELFSFRKL